MKIAILTPTFSYYSGMDRVVENQAIEYAKKGNEVSVIALEAGIMPKGYRVIELGMPKSPFIQRLYRLFFFLDRKNMNYSKRLESYDLIISHFYPMNWLAFRAKKANNRLKYVYWDHGINTTGLLDNFLHKFYMKLFLLFNNCTLKNADEAFSVSRYLSRQLWRESGIKSKVAYNKIDKKRFNKKANGKKIIKKYSLENKKTLLYVGRIAPHKGIHLLLKSFKLIKNEIPNCKLLIVGKPTFQNYFQKLKESADKDVIFTGFIDDNDLPSYYAACDLYITCSQWEGFNLPAAEVQACGKKVVAFDIGSHPEVIKNGILVKNNDIRGFAEAAIRLLGK